MHHDFQPLQCLLTPVFFVLLLCLCALGHTRTAEASSFVYPKEPSARSAAPTPRELAAPVPPGTRHVPAPEEPKPREQLEGELIALDALIERLERKDRRFEKQMLPPILIFGAGCFVTLLGVVSMSILATLSAGGFVFGSPLVWLVVGAILAVAGFGLVIVGGVLHGPIHKRRAPGMQDLVELKARRKHLADTLRRRFPRVSTLHLPPVAKGLFRVSF